MQRRGCTSLQKPVSREIKPLAIYQILELKDQDDRIRQRAPCLSFILDAQGHF